MFLLIHKHTYKAKDEIKRLGGKWDAKNKGWVMPSEEAYKEALSFCDAFNSVVYEYLDDWEESTKIGEGFNISPNYVINSKQQEKLDKNPIPLKDNIDKSVSSGLIFSGRGRNHRDIWIVTAFKKEWDLLSDNRDSFCCINMRTSVANFLTEEQIRQHVWKTTERIDLALAKTYYKRFIEA